MFNTKGNQISRVVLQISVADDKPFGIEDVVIFNPDLRIVMKDVTGNANIVLENQ